MSDRNFLLIDFHFERVYAEPELCWSGKTLVIEFLQQMTVFFNCVKKPLVVFEFLQQLTVFSNYVQNKNKKPVQNICKFSKALSSGYNLTESGTSKLSCPLYQIVQEKND